MAETREHRLTENAIRGSGSALDALWRQHRRWVAAIVHAHKPAEADAEDILQDVAAAVVHNIGSLLNIPSFIRSLKTRNRFSASSADQLPHHFAKVHGLCLAHVEQDCLMDKQCRFASCSNFVRRGQLYCKVHTKGKFCRAIECTKYAVYGGFCISHGHSSILQHV